MTVASRLLLGGPVALLTTSFRARHNVMPVAWHTPLSANPPLLGVAIEQSRHSAEMASHAEEFALNFPSRQLLHHVQYLGSISGSRFDKFELTQLETFLGAHVSSPLLAGCVAWVECEVRQVIPVGDHLLFVGLPVAVHVDPRAFGERWLVGEGSEQPLHFLGGNEYSQLHGVLAARVPRPSEDPVRVLEERVEEELELTREARERRLERLGELQREVEQGNVIDLSRVQWEQLPEPERPLRFVLPERPSGG